MMSSGLMNPVHYFTITKMIIAPVSVGQFVPGTHQRYPKPSHHLVRKRTGSAANSLPPHAHLCTLYLQEWKRGRRMRQQRKRLQDQDVLLSCVSRPMTCQQWWRNLLGRRQPRKNERLLMPALFALVSFTTTLKGMFYQEQLKEK